MATRKDPIRNFRFRLEIDGIQQAGFSEVSGFDITVDPIDYREGTDPTHVRKLTGLTKYGNVTLKWGITTSMDLYNWHRQIVDGEIVRKTIAIVSVNERGDDVNRWEVVDAWPTKYDPMDFNAKGNEAGIATLELVNQGVTQKS